MICKVCGKTDSGKHLLCRDCSHYASQELVLIDDYFVYCKPPMFLPRNQDRVFKRSFERSIIENIFEVALRDDGLEPIVKRYYFLENKLSKCGLLMGLRERTYSEIEVQTIHDIIMDLEHSTGEGKWLNV